jgi:hypothetical protein
MRTVPEALQAALDASAADITRFGRTGDADRSPSDKRGPSLAIVAIGTKNVLKNALI